MNLSLFTAVALVFLLAGIALGSVFTAIWFYRIVKPIMEQRDKLASIIENELASQASQQLAVNREKTSFLNAHRIVR